MAEVETRRFPGCGGVGVAVHHFGGQGPPVMIAHATGFHGRCYRRMAEPLVTRFSVWAVDLRGHGDSDRDPSGIYGHSNFAHDLLAVLDGLASIGAGGPWRGFGHSLGGAVVMLAEILRPGTFKRLSCYEPVVFPPEAFDPEAGSPPAAASGGAPRVSLADLARKRRPVFPSRQAAYDNYRSKPPFAAFDPVALRDYVEHGLLDGPDGTVTLACRREDEAAVFEGAVGTPVWGRLAEIRPPVAVLAGSDPDDPVSRVAPHVARRLPRGGFRLFPHLDHFGPMTAPDEVGAVVATALGTDQPESTMGVTPAG